MRLFAFPFPSGAAVRLVVGLAPGEVAHVRASPVPDPAAPQARDVITPSTRLYPASSPFIAREAPEREYWQYIDLDPSLAQGPVHYYARPWGGTGDWLHVEVDARRATRSAIVGVARDLVRPRLEWHLSRLAAEGAIPARWGGIPVLEQSALAQDDPLPVILLKEALSPIGSGIGLYRGEWKDLGNGTLYREYSWRYRARVDLLILSETPAERTELGNLIHGFILVDQPLLEDRGYRGLEVSRLTQMAFDPSGAPVFGEEITLDGEVELVVREEAVYAVREGNAFFVPLTTPRS